MENKHEITPHCNNTIKYELTPYLKDTVKYEKVRMLPMTFAISYIFTPLYILLSAAVLIAFGIMMEIDDQKYLIPGLLCLGGFAITTLVFLFLGKYAKNKDFETELELYDFDTSTVEAKDVWDYSTEEISLKFDKNGMYVNGELYYYNHLQKLVIMNNDNRRVNIFVMFLLSENQKVTFILDASTLKMLECLEITLDNQ